MAPHPRARLPPDRWGPLSLPHTMCHRGHRLPGAAKQSAGLASGKFKEGGGMMNVLQTGPGQGT